MLATIEDARNQNGRMDGRNRCKGWRERPFFETQSASLFLHGHRSPKFGSNRCKRHRCSIAEAKQYHWNQQGAPPRCHRHQIRVASHSYGWNMHFCLCFVYLIAYLKAGEIVMSIHHSSHTDIPTACLYGWLPLFDALASAIKHDSLLTLRRAVLPAPPAWWPLGYRCATACG